MLHKPAVIIEEEVVYHDTYLIGFFQQQQPLTITVLACPLKKSGMSSNSRSPQRAIKISSVGDHVKRGDGIKWRGLMQKLAFESKGLRKRMKKLSNGSIHDQIPELSKEEFDRLEPLLRAFTTRHQSHHRPIVLVSSGGTATDLEVHAVRYLDNFSTGQRGAISVEEFLKRGYAVIHLWREGSAAPYSRVLSKLLGAKQANHGLSFDALGKLFQGQQLDGESEEDVDMETEKSKNSDPWLTSTKTEKNARLNVDDESTESSGTGSRMNLTKHILNSTMLQTKLRERSDVVKEGLLLTVPFRTVEEYLEKLKVCSQSINDCQSLGLIYLTAAVSDFYIPKNEKSEHKIQSRDYGLEARGGEMSHSGSISMDPATNCLHVKLSPVPKMLSLIREDFAPNAFCVSFKLETDKDILLEKAQIAIKKYDMHMVIGNVLESRYDKVWILQNRSIYVTDDQGVEGNDFQVEEVSRNNASPSIDELEESMISHVVEKHFEYIANHYLESDDDSDESGVLPRTALMAGAEAATRHNSYLKEKKRQLQSELYWKRARDVTLGMIGNAIGMYLTFVASSALQKRMR